MSNNNTAPFSIGQEVVADQDGHFPDYAGAKGEYITPIFMKPVDSLRSLLKAQGLNEQNYVILEKI